MTSAREGKRQRRWADRHGEARAPCRPPIRACPGAGGAGWAPRSGAVNGSRPATSPARN